MIMQSAKNRWLIAASAVGIHISIGAIYAYSVLKNPLSAQLGWGFNETAWAFSIAILFLGLSAAFLGRKVERMGPRKSGMLAALFYASGLIISGVAIDYENLILFYVGYGVITGIGLGIGYICPVSTLVKWFPDRRGMATGLAIMGFGFGALLASSVMQFLMTSIGISFMFYLLGIVYLTIMMASANYLAPPPEGWQPAGMLQENEKPKTVNEDLAQLTSIEALKTVRFYYLWIMLFINVTCGIAVIGIAIPGLINMSAVQITLKRNLRAGILFSVGGAFVIFLQAIIGVGFAGYLAEHREILSMIKKLAILIFFILSIVFFYKGLRPKLQKHSKGQGHPILIGMAIAGMNVLNIPFFFTISTIGQAHGWVDLQQTFGFFMMSGLSVGGFCMLSLYSYFARYIDSHAGFFARNLNYFLSGLFLLLAVVQWVQLYFA